MLIRGARVLDPATDTDKICDIRISDGIVEELGTNLREYDDTLIDATGLTAAPGLVDVHAHFRDPGQTEKETLHTGALAAAAGGYTSVVCMANTIPAVDQKEILLDILDRAGSEKIHIYQDAAITRKRNGKELADLEYLKTSGAAGFSDDGSPITDESIVREAMKEAARLGAVLSFHEEDPDYVHNPGINSGRAAEALGLDGADRKAEYSMAERDMKIALETGARIDIQHVSAKETVQIIREYKKKDKLNLIHAEATPHHFSLTEEAVLQLGSIAKVNPPLRTEEDRKAIIEGLADGTLDLIATDHAPHTAEEKAQDIAKAPSGMTGLETALSLGITNLVETGYISLIQLIRLMSLNPARMYGLNAGILAPGKPADIVLFDPEATWIVGKDGFYSRSGNTPFAGISLKGKTVYTISDGIVVYHN